MLCGFICQGDNIFPLSGNKSKSNIVFYQKKMVIAKNAVVSQEL